MMANRDRRTPVHLVVATSRSENHREALRTLVKAGGAKIEELRSGDSYNASHITIAYKDYECLKMCLEIEMDPEATNNVKHTPQQMAYALCDGDETHPLVWLTRRYGSPASQVCRSVVLIAI